VLGVEEDPVKELLRSRGRIVPGGPINPAALIEIGAEVPLRLPAIRHGRLAITFHP
jgi:hypothetical protein